MASRSSERRAVMLLDRSQPWLRTGRRPAWRSCRAGVAACRLRPDAGVLGSRRAAAAAKRTEDGCARCSAKPMRSRRRNGQLLVELRKLEVERQIRVEELARIERDRDGRPAQAGRRPRTARRRSRRTAAAQRPDVEARLVQLYKLGRAGYWRLLLDVDDLQALGRAYRTASAMTEIDRERVQRALRARSMRSRASARRCRRAPRRSPGSRPRRSGRARPLDKAVAAPNGAGGRDRRPARPERAAGRRARDGAAAAAGVARADRARAAAVAAPLPLRPFQGDAALAGAPDACFGRFGRQPTSRSAPPSSETVWKSAPAEGQPVRSSPRRQRRVRRPVRPATATW